jgi:2-(1,2-epoxy-1,2-dihydrophenyl)acetyl-CoA isomerase
VAAVVSDDGAPVRVITLNRPDVRNAIDMPLRIELGDAIEAAQADSTVRAIVLTGAGGTFCSGGDISTMVEPIAAADVRSRTDLAQRVVRAIWRGDKPVIAAVEGAAFGAGLSLALACDRVVASSDARFGAGFARIGLAGDMGISATLPERLGPARARQFLMMARHVDASEAMQLGLVDAVVTPGAALTAALADAAVIADGPPLAIAAIRRGSSLQARLEALETEAANQVVLFRTADVAEGVAAFHQRRQPVFRGT